MSAPIAASADIWAPHLAPGEQIVWSAGASQALRRADISRQRQIYGLAGAASLLIAVMLAARFIESVAIVTAQPSLLAAFTPLYLVFALAMFALSLWGFRRMFARSPAAQHYAATGTRLIALDGAGSLIGQMAGADVEDVIASGRRRTPDVYVLRKDDPKEEHVFAIEHIDRPLEAKTIIEETFIPATTEEDAEPTP